MPHVSQLAPILVPLRPHLGPNTPLSWSQYAPILAPIRPHLGPNTSPFWSQARQRLHDRVALLGRRHPGGRLQWGALKEFSDGSLGSRTALMKEPYADGGPDAVLGKRVTSAAALRHWAEQADKAGLQVTAGGALPLAQHLHGGCCLARCWSSLHLCSTLNIVSVKTICSSLLHWHNMSIIISLAPHANYCFIGVTNSS